MYVCIYLNMRKVSSNKFNNKWQEMLEGISINIGILFYDQPNFFKFDVYSFVWRNLFIPREKIWLEGLLGLSIASFKDTMLVYASSSICCQSLKLHTNSKSKRQILPFRFCCKKKWWENIVDTTTKDILEKEFKQCVFSYY
jgi:hypothetical protein